MIFAYHPGNNFIITIIDDSFCIMEKNDLLTTLSLQRLEILLMRRTQISKHGYRWLNNVTKSKHLARLTDTSFKDTNLSLLVHQPDRQRHTYLRIVAARTAGDKHIWRKQLMKPFLDHSLTIGTSNAHDRNIKFITMALCQTLESFQRINHLQEISFRIVRSISFRNISNYEISNTTTIQLRNVVVTIITL